MSGKFLTGSLFAHVLVMASTSSIGLVTMFLVDFVDLFFIAQLGDAALTAAMGYAATLLFLNSALNIGLMIAISALASRQIGTGDIGNVRALFTQITLLGLAMAAVVSAIFWIFAPELMAMLGATGTAQDAAIDYIRITTPMGPITVAGMIASGLLRAYGDARRAMNATLAMAAGNAIFDPILIFGLGFGFIGAALATNIAILMMAATAIIPAVRIYGGYARISRDDFERNLPGIWMIMWPAVLTNMATPVGGIIIFRLISDFGDQAVAAYAVIGRITPLAFCLLFSLSGAVGPIIGQNYGGGNNDRVRTSIDQAYLIALGYTLIIWPILVILSQPISRIFNLTGIGSELIWLFALIVAPLFFFNGLLFISNATFNNLDRPRWSAALNWLRNTLGILPFALFGGYHYGAAGILVGPAIGGLLFGLLAYWLTYIRVRQL